MSEHLCAVSFVYHVKFLSHVSVMFRITWPHSLFPNIVVSPPHNPDDALVVGAPFLPEVGVRQSDRHNRTQRYHSAPEPERAYSTKGTLKSSEYYFIAMVHYSYIHLLNDLVKRTLDYLSR